MVHVVEELAAPVLIDRHSGSVKRVDEMPVPVVKIDADVLTPVGDAVLWIGVSRREVQWDLNWALQE